MSERESPLDQLLQIDAADRRSRGMDEPDQTPIYCPLIELWVKPMGRLDRIGLFNAVTQNPRDRAMLLAELFRRSACDWEGNLVFMELTADEVLRDAPPEWLLVVAATAVPASGLVQ